MAKPVVSDIPDLKLPRPFLHWVRCLAVGVFVTVVLALPIALCIAIALAGFFEADFQSVGWWEISRRVAVATLRGVGGFFVFYPLVALPLAGLFTCLTHWLQRYWDALEPKAGGKP